MGQPRYISVSERTTILAKGVLLYARVQNMSEGDASRSGAADEWLQWQKAYGAQMTNYAKDYQRSMFEDCQRID
jgi:hypothetical protein